MKRQRRLLAVLLAAMLCSVPALPVHAVDAALEQAVVTADAARTDYDIRTLDFPQVDRSDMTDGLVRRLGEDRYALTDWGYFHADDYKNTPRSRGTYLGASAVVSREGTLCIPWQHTMNFSGAAYDDGVYSIVCSSALQPYYQDYWRDNMRYSVSEYYDEDGNVLFAHEPFAAAGVMTDGVAWAAYPSDDCDYPLVQLIDKTGAMIADLSEWHFTEIRDWSEGLAGYCRLDADGNSHYGYFDQTGKIAFETDDWCGDFHNGLAFVKKDGKYGFLDKTGAVVIEPQFSALGDREGFTAESLLVKQDERWALIDTQGNFLTDFDYEMKPMTIPEMDYGDDHVYDHGCYSFCGGYAEVYRAGRFYLIDTKGRAVMESDLPLCSYGNGLFGKGRDAYEPESYDLIDISGQTVLSQETGALQSLGDGVFWVVTGGNSQFIEVTPAALAAGDLSGDGNVAADDAASVLIDAAQVGAGMISYLTPAQLKAADVNADGDVNAADASMILQTSAENGAGA